MKEGRVEIPTRRTLNPLSKPPAGQLQSVTQSHQAQDVARPDDTERLNTNVSGNGEMNLQAPRPRELAQILIPCTQSITSKQQIQTNSTGSQELLTSLNPHRTHISPLESDHAPTTKATSTEPIAPSKQTCHHFNPASCPLCSTNPSVTCTAPPTATSSLPITLPSPSHKLFICPASTNGASISLPSLPTSLSGQAPEGVPANVTEEAFNALPIPTPSPITSPCLASPSSFHPAPSLPLEIISEEAAGVTTVDVTFHTDYIFTSLPQGPQTHLGGHSDPEVTFDVNFGFQLMLIVSAKSNMKRPTSKCQSRFLQLLGDPGN
ncbi:hypothetical protein VP01_1170g2 [Puccinia sorghi]|uniref:Uncharacterized protein n=1 Tax=Puccinia sorghi TaxID=27349 RepID=A0A0L6VR96_9BASI|nr:hypothetical protein VP01_1170g2 [Puccinia sorghi]